MRILVTGSREWVHYGILKTVVHGGARGADTHAAEAASDLRCKIEAHPADWGMYGKAAGFIRNQEMVDAGADVCLAFYKKGAGNRGTADCVRRAKLAGIRVREFWA